MYRLLLGLVIALGCFFRLYHVPQTMLFLGDQGRDALIAKAILKDRDIALIGPVTSVGNMYLGPFYYYFMVPFLALTYPDPVGPAVGVAVINCLSLGLLAYIGHVFFSRRIAIVSTLIYALMPLAITYSRFSWNPNLGAPVGLALFWALLKWLQSRTWKFAVIVSCLFGILIQLHYVTLTTVGVIALIWLGFFIQQKKERKSLLGQLLAFIVIVGICLSPLAIFNLRHDNMLVKQFSTFFTSGEQHIQPPTHWLTVVKETEGRAYRILSQIISGQKRVMIDRIFSLIGIGIYLWLFWKKRILQAHKQPVVLVLMWIGMAIVGTSFYSSSIMDHYLTYCFPIVALFWGVLIGTLLNESRTMILAAILGTYVLVILIQGDAHFDFSGSGTIKYQKTAQVVSPQLTIPYNIALLGANGDFQGMNYRYFFDVSEKKPQGNEAYTGLSSLAIIDEIGNDHPLSVAAYEIQAPQLSSQAAVLTVPDGPRVFIFK